jgi:hypothetical protein
MPKKDPFVEYGVTAFYHFTDRRNLPMITRVASAAARG